MSKLSATVSRRVAGCCWIALLAGCAVGPEFEVPETEWRNRWEAGLYEEMGTAEREADFDLRFWWQLFDDPVLDNLIQLARQENLSLRIAGLRVLETRAALGIARGFLYPQVQQLTADGTYIGNKAEGQTWQDDFVSDVGANVGWEIDFWGRFRRSVESADAAFFASIANQHDFQVLLTAQVVDLYYSYRATLLRLNIAKKNAEIQKRSFDITRQLYESGEESELDLQQAKTQYMATLAIVPEFEMSLHKLRNALGLILGRAPGDLPELDDELRELPMVDPIIVREIPAQLLMRRPDIRAAAALVAAQTAQVGVAESAKYPHISLFGSVGWSESTLSLGVGPSLTWDIFNYGRIKNNVRVEDARLQQSIENFQLVALEAAREIDDAAITVVKTREQREPQRESTRAAERSLELANTRYREGYSGFERVIDAQRAAATQNDRELVNQSDHISAIVAFYKAVGGGWHEMTLDEMLPATTREKMESRTNWGDLLRDPLPPESDDSIENQPKEPQ